MARATSKRTAGRKTAPRKAPTTLPAIRNPYEAVPVEVDEKASQTFALFKEIVWSLDDPREAIDRLLKKYGTTSTWVYVCVNRIACTAAGIPIQIQKRNREGKPNALVTGYDGGLLELMDRPNPYQSAYDFFEQIYASLELTGNAFVEKAMMDRLGRPKELYVLNPSRMTIIPDPKEFVKGYVFTVNGRSIAFPANEIIHIKYLHPSNDYYGLGPLTAARLSVEMDESSRDWNKNFLDKGAWPVGAIESDQAMDDRVVERLKKDIKRTVQQGKDQAGRLLILTGGLKYNPLSILPKDVDWSTARNMSRDEILAIFGVPYAIAGLWSNEQTTSRSAGTELQVKNFYRMTLFPKLYKVLNAFNLHLVPAFSKNYELIPNLRDVPALQDDAQRELVRAQTFRTLTGAGWSPNAALAELYPHVSPFPWGDVAYFNGAMVPTDGAAPNNQPLSGAPAGGGPGKPGSPGGPSAAPDGEPPPASPGTGYGNPKKFLEIFGRMSARKLAREIS